MHWFILTHLISLAMLVSCVPANGALIPKLESEQKDFLSAIEANYLVATSRAKEKSISTSSPYALIDKLPIVDQNTSVSNVSTPQTSQSQEAIVKPDKEVGMGESSTDKEDQDIAEHIISTHQVSQNQGATDKPEKEFEIVEQSKPIEKEVEHTIRDKNITDYNFSSNQTSQADLLEQRANTHEKDKPTKREDVISSEEEDAEIIRQTQSEAPSQPAAVDPSIQSLETPEEAPEKPALLEETTAGATTNPPTTKRPRPPKPKPPRATTQSPVPVTATATVKPTSASEQRYPCRCADGTCSCCTGIILENFNVPLRSRACANVTYEPDEFAFNFKLAYNSIVLYNRRMSAKNPRPACIPINRYFGIKMCAKLSNVYMSGRNVHACLDFEGFFDDETAFKYSFNCFRIGSQGVAIVRPEDGGGLPPPPDEEEQTDEDYDDSARAWRSRREVMKRLTWKQ